MCHDVMAGGRQREGILQEGVCKGGREGVANSLSRLAQSPQYSDTGTRGTGDTICQFLLLLEQIICTHYHFICML